MRDWRELAACREVDPELFFPVGTSGPALAQAEQAKQICRGCEVRDECLEWAIAHRIDDGIWGGMSEEGRRKLRRIRARQAVQA